jgi:hypothetical protein
MLAIVEIHMELGGIGIGKEIESQQYQNTSHLHR